MAKVTIVGQACVITSAVKLDDIKLIKKYRPEALSLYEGEGNERVPVFSIGVTGAGNCINNVGAEFSHANEEGYAQITLMVTKTDKEEIADAIGRPILKLNKLEESLAAVIDEIAAEKAAILENIEVAG